MEKININQNTWTVLIRYLSYKVSHLVMLLFSILIHTLLIISIGFFTGSVVEFISRYFTSSGLLIRLYPNDPITTVKLVAFALISLFSIYVLVHLTEWLEKKTNSLNFTSYKHSMNLVENLVDNRLITKGYSAKHSIKAPFLVRIIAKLLYMLFSIIQFFATIIFAIGAYIGTLIFWIIIVALIISLFMGSFNILSLWILFGFMAVAYPFITIGTDIIIEEITEVKLILRTLKTKEVTKMHLSQLSKDLQAQVGYFGV